MAFYRDRVLPHLIELLLGGARFGPLRTSAMEGLAGEVLEIGFGSGPNVPWYPPAVTRVVAVEPSGTARRLAAKRLAASDVPVDFVGLDGNRIDLPDASVDAALSTFTLCTVPDEVATLTEIARILRPGGRLFFLEHGLADDARLVARQKRFEPLQQRFGGGCHLTRDHAAALARAGYVDIDHATFQISGPATSSFLYAGSARRADAATTAAPSSPESPP